MPLASTQEAHATYRMGTGSNPVTGWGGGVNWKSFMDQKLIDDLNHVFNKSTEDYEKTKYHRDRFHRIRHVSFWVFAAGYMALIVTYFFWRSDGLGWVLAILGLFFFYEKHLAENRLDRYLRTDLDFGYTMLKDFHEKINEMHANDQLRDTGKTAKPQ